MPEPDFEQIASRIFSDHGQLSIANALRDMWNARGAADVAALNAYLRPEDEGTGTIGAIVSMDALEGTIRSVDRP